MAQCINKTSTYSLAAMGCSRISPSGKLPSEYNSAIGIDGGTVCSLQLPARVYAYPMSTANFTHPTVCIFRPVAILPVLL